MESLGDILRRIRDRGEAGLDGGGEEGASALGADRTDCAVCGGSRFVSVSVPLGDPMFGRAVPCRECWGVEDRGSSVDDSFLRYSNLGGLAGIGFEGSLPGGPLGDRGSADLFSRAMERCREFAEAPDGWLVLTGPSGCGKTHLAAAIVNRRLALREPAFFIVCSDLLDHLRAGYGPDSVVGYDELFERVREVPLLVLDAVGSHYGTAWAEEKLLQVLDHRYAGRMPTVVTLSVPLARVRSEGVRLRLSDRGGVSTVLPLGHFEVSSRAGLGVVDPARLLRETFGGFSLREEHLAEEVDRASLSGALAGAVRFADSLDGWLLLSGGHGSGKSHLAVAVAGVAMARGVRVLFAFVPSLLDHLRSTFVADSAVSYDEIFDDLVGVELLVLDGLGAERATPWAEEKLYQLMSLRYDARRPTVVTTSSSLDELAASRPAIHARLADLRVVRHLFITAPGLFMDSL